MQAVQLPPDTLDVLVGQATQASPDMLEYPAGWGSDRRVETLQTFGGTAMLDNNGSGKCAVEPHRLGRVCSWTTRREQPAARRDCRGEGTCQVCMTDSTSIT